jgi:hypothetical protein
MRRVLDSSNLSIDRKTYYNLVRGRPLDQSNDSFEGLVLALEEVGFKFDCLMGDELAEDGSVKGRILEQLFFIIDDQIAYARRFIAHQVLLIDGTFETNRLGMVLLVVVGITSTNKNFPAAHSFAKSESAEAFTFLLDCFKHFVFGNDIAEARVVLADQAAGLIAAMPAVMPQAKFQRCNWHVSKNIAKRLAEKRYLVEERKEIMNYVWWYIRSSTKAELSENRRAMVEKMKISEQEFVAKHWQPKEDKFVSAFTRFSPNLGCNSTQKSRKHSSCHNYTAKSSTEPW